MAYRDEAPRSRLGLRVSILTLIAVGFAGCSSDVTRFSDPPFSSPYASRNAPSGDVTGSISRGPSAPTGRVESRPLPQTQAAALPPPPARNPSATGSSAGTAVGAPGMASYRPPYRSGDVTGSVAPAHTLQPPAASRPVKAAMTPPQPRATAGAVVTIGPGDTIAKLSRRYGVSMSAIIKANRLASPGSLKIGQRITIPGRGAATPSRVAVAPRTPVAAPASVPAARSYGGFHIAGPGDTLSKIARRYRVSVTDLARANRIAPHAQIGLGDRLTIPAHVSARPAPAAAPRAEAPVQPQQTASVAPPPHTAKYASPAEPAESQSKRVTNSAVFRWPVRGRIVTAFGGKPNGQQNDGINIAVPEGTPIKAAEDGDVAYSGNELKGYGNLILVRHPNGFVTAYAHASQLLVKRGDKVKRGQIIAKSGRTGAISSPQLHFEIRKGSTPVDPTPYLGS
jgi:murein DD-endopeptidase MepM/ murein hydrolase activator NlpD